MKDTGKEGNTNWGNINTGTIKTLVRPILAVIGFGAITAMFLQGKVGTDTYAPMVSMMIAWWYATREKGKP